MKTIVPEIMSSRLHFKNCNQPVIGSKIVDVIFDSAYTLIEQFCLSVLYAFTDAHSIKF